MEIGDVNVNMGPREQGFFFSFFLTKQFRSLSSIFYLTLYILLELNVMLHVHLSLIKVNKIK